MTAKTWAKRIKEATISAGTYRDFFDPVISTLAGILERRDMAEQIFKENGCVVIVEHTNKSGATNKEQNPVLRLINDLNRDALAYWRDLGLTPAGLKRINEKALDKKKSNPLAEVLKDLGS